MFYYEDVNNYLEVWKMKITIKRQKTADMARPMWFAKILFADGSEEEFITENIADMECYIGAYMRGEENA